MIQQFWQLKTSPLCYGGIARAKPRLELKIGALHSSLCPRTSYQTNKNEPRRYFAPVTKAYSAILRDDSVSLPCGSTPPDGSYDTTVPVIRVPSEPTTLVPAYFGLSLPSNFSQRALCALTFCCCLCRAFSM